MMSTTTLGLPPTRVTEDMVRRACAGSLLGSGVCPQRKEQQREWDPWEAARGREETRLQQTREQRLAVAYAGQQQRRQTEREAAMAPLKAQPRSCCFSANRTVAECDTERLSQCLLADELIQRVRAGGDTEVTAARRRGRSTL
jgi:hypothetical protein